MQSLAGQSLGKYEILEEIGRGGFATVYKALDTTLDRLVALKVLAPHLIWDTNFVTRFKEEARTAANLHHPSIVIIYEVGEADGVHYIAMEYLPGRNLSTVLAEEGSLPLLDVVNIIDQLASALDYTHASELVHRDIKPSNVIISDVGHATLTDFGIVKAATGSRLTATGTIMGTPEYMSPEQVTGEELGPSSDIYSLGIVCYEMLAGQAPFSGTTASVLHSHVYEPPPLLGELEPGLPQGVPEVIDKALAKKSADRFASAGEMAGALRAAMEGIPIALEPPATVAVRQPPTEAAAAPARPAEAPTAVAPRPAVRPKPALPMVAAALVVGGVIVVGAAYMAVRGPKGSPTPTKEGPAILSTATSPPVVYPTATSRPAEPTFTLRPATSAPETQPPTREVAAPTDTVLPPTGTPVPTARTPVPPTDTPLPPSPTPVPPTNTPVPPTHTPVPPTPVPPTNTPVPPTQAPPTNTPVPPTQAPPTNTPVPPTQAPPTNTPVPPTPPPA